MERLLMVRSNYPAAVTGVFVSPVRLTKGITDIELPRQHQGFVGLRNLHRQCCSRLVLS